MGVNLHQVHRDQLSRFVHTFGDEVAFAQSQAAADRGTGADDEGGVEGVDVEGEVDWGFGTEVGEGGGHYVSDAVSGEVSG